MQRLMTTLSVKTSSTKNEEILASDENYNQRKKRPTKIKIDKTFSSTKVLSN